MRPTVHDIAAAASVSLATVDRVLNRRPGVREETRMRVESAIARIGYVRDVAAANLAKGRTYSFVFIVPDNDNSFMQALRMEVRQAMARASVERAEIHMIEIAAFDAAAQVKAISAAMALRPAGICLVAIDRPDVTEAVTAANRQDVPVVTLVSDLPHSDRSHFVGIDNVAAGRTAGSLMGRFLGGRPGRIGVIAGSLDVRDHRERLEGFSSLLAEDFPALQLLPVLEGRDDPARVEELVQLFLAANPDVCGIYNLGAGNRGLIRALHKRPKEAKICVIAHELTTFTRDALFCGLFDAVLNQDPGHEVRSALRVLKAKADGVEVIPGQEKIRIDIFLKENLP